MTYDSEAWKADWQRMIAAVGRDFDDRPLVFVADRIECSAVRRWLEPLEFDCALHYDRDVARRHGHDDIVVPVAALPTFALDPMWRPGDVLFDSDARDAQPSRSAVSGICCGLEPPTTGFFATDIDIDYLQTVTVGDCLMKHGALLVACEPKETRVGRGAFTTWQSQLINERLDVVARTRTTLFRYNLGSES
ncbi:MaoC family dehydratase N-terminal domain-containing protein [Burkholderia anthina]|uniref:FAS1-like dehydratase domain-containing protein n=1 Tax=Burkholderia anthina TaxID=179879 RepID=UPI0037C192FA